MYDYVIIAGDFNVDFAKVSPNHAILEYFIKPLTSLGVIISHSHTGVTNTSSIPGFIMLFVLQLFQAPSAI